MPCVTSTARVRVSGHLEAQALPDARKPL